MGVIGEVTGFLSDCVDGFVWTIPGTISSIVGELRNYEDSRIGKNVYGAIKGVVDGTIKLHHLPATMGYEPRGERRNFREHYDREPAIETIARRLTMVAEAAGYTYLFSHGNPVWIAPIATNVIDAIEFNRDCEWSGECNYPDPDWIKSRYSLM